MNLRLLKAVCLFLVGVFFVSSCSYHQSPQTGEPVQAYTDESYALVLTTHRDEQGRIDYEALSQDPKDLGRYYQKVAAISPQSHPERFLTKEERLAYWINAYNATAMWNVIQHYPIKSVLDVRVPVLGPLLPKPTGFFVNQKFTYGGKSLSLYTLERKIIQKRFPDPRVHFALNCASLGCPILPGQPFRGKTLDRNLDREARRFINDPKYVRINEATGTIHLSSIFQWYQADFIQWLKTEHPELEPSLISYVTLYFSAEQKRSLKRIGQSPKISFISYDWALNDRAR